MKKRILLLTGIFALLAMAVVALGLPMRPAAQEKEPKPTLIPLEVQTPAPTPPDQREVAILTLVITSNPEGKIEDVALEQGLILRSYAPNVLDRTGPWTVELVGEEGFRYGVEDPRRQRVYPSEEGESIQNEFATQVIWELVVPLYLFEKDLNVREINLYDETGNHIFTTEVDRGKWQ